MDLVAQTHCRVDGGTPLRLHLDAVLETFVQGLGLLAQGQRPQPEPLRELAAGPLAVLSARQADVLALRRRTHLRRTAPDQPELEARSRITAAALVQGQHLQRLDTALLDALELLEGLLDRWDFDSALALTAWCAALHPELAALPALSTARALCLKGRFADAVQALTLPQVGGSLGRLVADMAADCRRAAADPACRPGYLCAQRPRRLELGLPPGQLAICLAPGPQDGLFVASYADDLSSGRLSLHSASGGPGAVLLEDVLPTGVFFDAATGEVLLSARRSKHCPRPHVVWLDTSGRVLRHIEFPDLDGAPCVPGFATLSGGRLFVRDGVSKALVEADPQALCVTGVHQNHRLKSSVGFSAVFGRVFVHFVNGSGMLELHPETGEFTSCEGGWPGQAYRLVTGGQGAPCCALVPMRVFDTHLRVNAQACSLYRIWPDGRSRLLSVFAGGNCSDIAVLPRRDGFSVFVASSGTIMKHDFGEEQ